MPVLAYSVSQPRCPDFGVLIFCLDLSGGKLSINGYTDILNKIIYYATWSPDYLRTTCLFLPDVPSFVTFVDFSLRGR